MAQKRCSSGKVGIDVYYTIQSNDDGNVDVDLDGVGIKEHNSLSSWENAENWLNRVLVQKKIDGIF